MHDITSLPSWQLSTKALYQKANIFRKTNRPNLAIDYYTQVIQRAPQHTKAYWYRGNLYAKQNNYQRAILDYRKVTQLAPKSASGYGTLGWYLILEGHFLEAFLVTQKAHQLKPKNFAWAINMGHVFLLMNNIDMAHHYYQKAIPHIPTKQKLNQEPLADFDIFIKKGWHVDSVQQQKRWLTLAWHESKAIRYLKALIDKNPQDPKTLTNMALLAKFHTLQGHYEKAEQLLTQVVALRTKVLGKKHPQTLASMHNLAGLYRRQGHYEKAKQYYLKAISLSQSALGKEHLTTINMMNGLAVTYSAQGLYDQAEPLQAKVVTLRKKILGHKHTSTLTAMSNLAILYQKQGHYHQAKQLFLDILSISQAELGEKHPDTLSSMNNLAAAYVAEGQYKKALPLLTTVLALRKKAFGDQHPDTLDSMNNLGHLYHKQGNYHQAEQLYHQALILREQTLGKTHPSTLTSINNLAGLYHQQGKYDQAKSLYIQSVTALKNTLGEKHPHTLIATDNLAINYAANQQYALAEALVKKNMLNNYDFLQHILWGASHRTRLSYLQKQQGRKNFYLTLLTQHNLFKNAQQALNYSLLNKGLLLQIESQVKLLSLKNQDPTIQKQLKTLTNYRQQLSNIFLSNKQTATQTTQLETKIHQLQASLGQQIEPLQRAMIKVTPNALIQHLRNSFQSATFIDYLIYKHFDYVMGKSTTHQLMAIVVNPKHTPPVHLISLGQLAPISKLIKQYRHKLKNSYRTNKITKRQQQLGQKLYQALWLPLLDHLNKEKTIYLSADGILHLLPFATLIDTQKQYLISNWSINMVSSGRDLVLPTLNQATHSAAIFSAPLYDPTQAQQYEAAISRLHERTLSNLLFSPLPGALKEGQQLTRLMHHKKIPVKHFKLAQATEQQLTQIQSPRILHLATHGYFLNNMPQNNSQIRNPLLRAGLAFSHANLGIKGQTLADGTDGILSAEEALGLDLMGTELVVLSACETGIGKIQPGEGIYGLRRAFQEAGAKAVLSTLWSISDHGTQAFMQYFYRLFLDGVPPQTALRMTQRAFSQTKQWHAPYYWAPFVMMGVQ